MYATVTILLYGFLTEVVIAGRRGKRVPPRDDAEGEPLSDRPERSESVVIQSRHRVPYFAQKVLVTRRIFVKIGIYVRHNT